MIFHSEKNGMSVFVIRSTRHKLPDVVASVHPHTRFKHNVMYKLIELRNKHSLRCCPQASVGQQSVTNGATTPQQFSLTRDPQRRLAMQQAYHRLKDRQKKLSALRRGLGVIDADTDMDISDMASLHSEATNYSDGRSLVSAMSVRQGGWSGG